MPFTWSYIEKKGQLWGNRNYNNVVSVINPYRLSYAGYNEIFTGFADPLVIFNKTKNNRNSNVLSYLNSLPEYKGRVAMFGSWNLFTYIINGTENKIPLNTGYQECVQDSLSITDEFYRNKTMIFITTDHGRGRKPNKWTAHGPLTHGSDETWMIQLGPNIKPGGEMKEKMTLYNREFAQIIAYYMGKVFVAAHPVATPLYSFLK